MPAARHSATAAGTVGRTGSVEPDEAEQLEREVVLARRQGRSAESSPRDAEHAQPVVGHRADVARQLLPRAPASRWHRSAIASGAPLAAIDVVVARPATSRRATSRAAPATAGTRAPASSPRGGARSRPGTRRRARLKAFSIGSNGSRWLARIAYSTSSWKVLGQRAAPRRRRRSDSPPARRARAPPSVQRQRAGLVHAQHGGRAERLDRRHAARQHAAAARSATRPSARKIVSTTGNSSGSIAIASVRPASSPPQPVAARQAVDHDDQRAQRERRAARGCARGGRVSRCERRRLGLDRLRGLADLAHLGRGPVASTRATPWPCTTSVPE